VRILRFVFLVGAFALVYSVTAPYPLLGAGPMLLASGTLVLAGAGIMTMKSKSGLPTASHWFMSLFPWLLAGFLLANGARDHSHEVLYQTVVVTEDFARYWDIVRVQSWRPGHATESLYIKTGFNFRTGSYVPGGFFFDGKPIAVGVRGGALGMPWISTISQGHNDLHYPQ
jgi:hypothetical protein